MGVSDWNWKLPMDLQDYAWDCSANATAWCLRAVGLKYTEQDVIKGLGPTRISPTQGLLDASGAGLVQYLAEIGVTALNDADSSWAEVQAAAGHQPMVIGGRAWYHWVAVRMGSDTVGHPEREALLLMNGSPGYVGVYQLLDKWAFDKLGPFSAVWFTHWPSHPPV